MNVKIATPLQHIRRLRSDFAFVKRATIRYARLSRDAALSSGWYLGEMDEGAIGIYREDSRLSFEVGVEWANQSDAFCGLHSCHAYLSVEDMSPSELLGDMPNAVATMYGNANELRASTDLIFKLCDLIDSFLPRVRLSLYQDSWKILAHMEDLRVATLDEALSFLAAANAETAKLAWESAQKIEDEYAHRV